jgi:hypothetical protein
LTEIAAQSSNDGGTAAHVVATNEIDDLAILKVDGGLRGRPL